MTEQPEQTDPILARTDEIKARGDSPPRLAPDEVSTSMIRHWAEAMGDTNPRWAPGPDTEAPPAMAQVWTMYGLTSERMPGDPLPDTMKVLDDAGFTGVLGTNCDQTYVRTLRPGERVRISTRLHDVMGPKKTGVGEGYFITTRSTWSVGPEDDPEVVATMQFRVLKFIDAAVENEDATVALLRDARTVLQTQQDSAADIRGFAHDLADVTGTLAASDKDLETILSDAAPAADELTALMSTLREVLPPALRHFYNVNDVLNARLPALEQLLVTFPRLVAAGPSALTEGEQKFGRVNLNLNQDPPACTDGYLPPGQWRPSGEESFVPFYPAECKSDAPINMRGMKHAPDPIDWRSVYGVEE